MAVIHLNARSFIRYRSESW